MIKTKIKKKKLLFYIAIVALPILQFCIFYIYVNFNSIMLAFKEYDYALRDYRLSGLMNFKVVFEDIFINRALMPALKNTLVIFCISLTVGTILPVFVSYYIYKKRLGNKIFQLLLMLPSVLSAFALILAYKYFVEIAVPEVILQVFGKQIDGLLNNQSTLFATVLFYTYWFGTGTSFLLYASTMTSIPESVIEAAEIDGVTAFQEFIKIILPLIFATYATFVVMTTATIFSNQANLYSFFANDAFPRIHNIAYYLYMRAATSNFTDFPYLSAFGVMCSFVVIPVCFLVRYLLNAYGPGVE